MGSALNRGYATLLLFLVIGVACDSRSVAPDRLTGTWVLELELQESSFQATPVSHNLRGRLHLVPASASDASLPFGLDNPTHSGHADIDFTPFGFGKYPWMNVRSTTIVGDAQEGSTFTLARDFQGRIEVLINPYVSHGGIVFDGGWNGPELTGTWMVPGYVPMASGTFVLRREA